MKKTEVLGSLVGLLSLLAGFALPANANGAPKPGTHTILEIALVASDFNHLADALLYVDEELDAGLVDLLSGSDQYTVFAPTDLAFSLLFDKLGVENVRDLAANTVLTVLLHHVTEGRRDSNSVIPKGTNARKIDTVGGTSFFVNADASIEGGGNIISANVSGSNGLIHVIDKVLLP